MKNKKPQIVIVSGPKNSGKTSYLQFLLDKIVLRGKKVGGFLSEGFIDKGKKYSYYLINVNSGEISQYALKNEDTYGYDFDISVFDRINSNSESYLEYDYIFIDEYGMLEDNKEGFYSLFEYLLKNFSGVIFVSVRPKLLKSLKQLIKDYN